MTPDAPVTAAEVQRLAEGGTSLLELPDGSVEVTLPFLDRRKKPLQIGVYREKSKYVISDGGLVVESLGPDAQGEMLAKRFGLKMVDGYLVARAVEKDFAKKFWAMAQCVVAVDALGLPG